mgnify:FL=1
MSTTETLAQLICRTVLEFEQRQALQQDIQKNTSVSTRIETPKQTISKQKSA